MAAEMRARRDVDLVGLAALLEFLRLQFLEALQAGLALGLAALGVLALVPVFARRIWGRKLNPGVNSKKS